MLKGRDAWKLAATYLAIGLAASAVILFLLAQFHEEITEPFLSHFDRLAMQSVHAHVSAPLTAFMFVCSFIGAIKVFLPATLVLVGVLWWRRDRADAVLLLLAIGGATALNFGLKVHFRRLRPDVPWALAHEHSFSFPSGHSLFAIVLYGTVSYLLLGRTPNAAVRAGIVTAALGMVACIGLSRVYLGVHYPTDVAAGYLVGSIWLAALIGSDWNFRRRTHSEFAVVANGGDAD